MPAGSDPEVPALPVTFRPFGVRIAVVVFAVMLLALMAAVWVAFPQNVRDSFTTLQRLTVLGFVLAAGVASHALVRCRVDATDSGLRVVNGYSSREYEWDQVTGIRLRPGAPWAILDLADGRSAAAVGIQGSDGARAATQVKQLRALVAQKTAQRRGRETPPGA